ncbi:MAG TPA: DUF3291 domain-containing protein [Alphaproteobacteria bacterium]|nr:DUF3291 domain-containing protein [Alphaproteobacteria bacterium]
MTGTKWHIAQLNLARAVAPLDSPQLAEFVAALDAINALGEASPGFVWRLQGDVGNATDIKVSDDPNLIANMTVWDSVEALFQFVYRSGHTKVMARRREWFEKPTEAYQVLWWIPEGAIPTIEEAMARLRHLREHGATPHAFTFKDRFPPPDEPGAATDMKPEPYCVGWS